jgi:hypothetical protein
LKSEQMVWLEVWLSWIIIVVFDVFEDFALQL